ncbi:MAG: MBL fold metallo-hydrolase [Candidatus Puniceispirillaceae bacterium]
MMNVKTTMMRVVMIAACLILSPLARAQDAPQVTRLTDNVHTVFWGFYNGLVVIGRDGVLITDPANDNRAAVLRDEIAKLTDLPVTHIVLTHEHFDHIGGTGAFPDAQIIAQEYIRAVLPLDPLNLAPDDIDVGFVDRHVIDMGTTRVELRFLGAGDGVATTVVHLPQERIAFTADLYEEERLTPASFLEDTNMVGVRRILHDMQRWNLVHAVTAHSAGTSPSILEANIRYFDDLYEAVYPPVAAAAQSDNPFAMYGLLDTLPETVTLADYAGWSGYEHLPGHVRRMVLAIIHGG